MPITTSKSHGPQLALQQKQTQQLVMSPQMRQALHLLQLPLMEMTTYIETEMAQNPLLEYSEEGELYEDREAEDRQPDKDPEEVSFNEGDFKLVDQLEAEFGEHWDQSGCAFGRNESEYYGIDGKTEEQASLHQSLYNLLLEPVREQFKNDKEREVAENIIGSLDSNGLLTVPLSEIAILCRCEETLLLQILKRIQNFDPPGIAARSIQEALLIQLERMNKANSTAYIIVKDHYRELLHNQIPLIAKALSLPIESITTIINKEISILNLHPGQSITEDASPPIYPEVIFELDIDDKLSVKLKEESLPTLKLNRRYLAMLSDKTIPTETRDFIKQKLLAAKNLMHNIVHRNNTLTRLATILMTRQQKFLSHAEGELIPLTMREVAQELELHESTITRAVADKYAATPRGTYPLRFFFTNAYITEEGDSVSSNSIREALQKLISAEDPHHPISDQHLSEMLQAQGVLCARRTISKYRAELKIGNAQQRKKH